MIEGPRTGDNARRLIVVQISFNFQSDPIGGSISNFLLEKSRIVQTGAGERSFHIFYQLTRGANATVKSQYFVEDPEYFNFLKASGSTVVKGYNDKDEFKMTLCKGTPQCLRGKVVDLIALAALTASLAAMDIPAETVSEILRIVSAVLWLGQIEFTKAAEKPTGSNGALITIDDKDGAVKKVAELLKCSEADLRYNLTQSTDCFASHACRTEKRSCFDRSMQGRRRLFPNLLISSKVCCRSFPVHFSYLRVMSNCCVLR